MDNKHIVRYRDSDAMMLKRKNRRIVINEISKDAIQIAFVRLKNEDENEDNFHTASCKIAHKGKSIITHIALSPQAIEDLFELYQLHKYRDDI
jgi:GTP cyclohydrolase II